MHGDFPRQEETAYSGNYRCSSDFRLAHIEWNNLVQPETPALKATTEG